MTCLQFVLVVLLTLQPVDGVCNADSLKEAANFVRNSDGSEMKTEEWGEGESYTLKCKQDKIAMAWSNNVRTVKGVDLPMIDQYSPGARGQQGEVIVKCSGDKFTPDIFGYDVYTWCAAGCNKVPEDFKKYWAAIYPAKSITKRLDEAPISIEIDNSIILYCRRGYAQATADEGRTEVFCTNAGWSPSMLYWPKCVAGCSDITNLVENGATLAAPSTTAGQPPFRTGDIVEYSCKEGFNLTGSSAVTCTSGQFWDTSWPTCLALNPGTGTTSADLKVGINRVLLLGCLTVVLYHFYKDLVFTKGAEFLVETGDCEIFETF